MTCTDRINIHVQNAPQDFPHFEQIAESALFEKVRQIFEYSLHDTVVSRFRKMLTIEQFRSPELAALFSGRYVDRIIDYHARIFKDLIAAGELAPENPKTLSLLYVAPIITLLGGTLPGLFSGAMVTETLFQIPGIGYTSYQAVLQGDIPFVMFYMLFSAVLILLGNLIADILYAVVDPRVRVN